MKHPVLLILLLTAHIFGFSQAHKTEVTRFKYLINTGSSIAETVDTVLTGSQIHHPLYSSPGSWSDLGNTGLPAVINEYRPVRSAFDPLLFEGIDGYGVDKSDLTFYSAKSPFSLLNYNSGGTADKNGQTIRGLFARNLKKNGNISVLGNYYNSDGHFSNQKANSSAIHANYILNRNNYHLVTGISRYSFGYAENGGLKSDDQLAGSSQPAFLTVNLTGAATKMTAFIWQGNQRGVLNFAKKQNTQPKPKDSASLAAPAGSLAADSIKKPVAEVKGIKFNHVFRISSISRKYSDAGSDAGFYANNYSGTKGTSDSVRFLSWTNRISLLTDTVHLGKFPLLFSGGLSPDMYRYLRADTVNVGIALGINGKVTTEGKTSRAEITAAWTAAGYSAGDYSLDATFTLLPGEKEKKPQVTLELFTRGCSPDPTIRDYKSAHFRWRNDFLRQREAGLNIRMDMPGIKTSLVAAIATDKNRIYFDTLGLPAQLTGRLTVYSLKATKEFKAGPFRSSVRALVQYSTSGEIRLPLFTGSTSTYMHHDIHFKSTGGEIQVEYGLDLNFNTAFYGYAYMPATGAFFLENEKELGNYPYLNIFAQMKVKRTRVFVAWCQTLADMMPAESFAVLHYPSMRPHLKYGIYWHFYD